MFTIKKVPIIGDMEKGLDDSIKEVMGPLSMVYPLLKYSLIFSNPASALAYTGYRSIPYALDALTSKRAVNAYKTAGKTIGRNLLKLGGNVGKIAIKYGKKIALNLGELGKQQIENVTNYFKDKDYSFNKFKDKFNDIEFTNSYNVSNNYEEPRMEDFAISREQERIENNIRAASFLFDFNVDKAIQNSRAKIKQDVIKYQPHIKEFEESVDTSNIKKSEPEKGKNLSEFMINGNVRYKDVDGSITTRLATPLSKERFNNKTTFAGLDQENSTNPINSKPKEDSIKIADDCSVLFTRNADGSYMQTYRFGDTLGQSMQITEEQYKQFKLDAKGLNKEREKEKDYELEM